MIDDYMKTKKDNKLILLYNSALYRIYLYIDFMTKDSNYNTILLLPNRLSSFRE